MCLDVHVQHCHASSLRPRCAETPKQRAHVVTGDTGKGSSRAPAGEERCKGSTGAAWRAPAPWPPPPHPSAAPLPTRPPPASTAGRHGRRRRAASQLRSRRASTCAASLPGGTPPQAGLLYSKLTAKYSADTADQHQQLATALCHRQPALSCRFILSCFACFVYCRHHACIPRCISKQRTWRHAHVHTMRPLQQAAHA